MIFLIIIWSLWLLSEIFLNRMYHSISSDKKGEDRKTTLWIWVVLTVSIALGVTVAFIFPVHVCSNMIPVYTGTLLVISGIIIRWIAIFSLGKFFTVDVTIRPDHRIKKNGIYRLVRHPAYSGMIVSFAGFGLSLNNWISICLIAFPVITIIIHRIRIEEKVLCDHFGAEYIDYMKLSKRLFPWIY